MEIDAVIRGIPFRPLLAKREDGGGLRRRHSRRSSRNNEGKAGPNNRRIPRWYFTLHENTKKNQCFTLTGLPHASDSFRYSEPINADFHSSFLLFRLISLSFKRISVCRYLAGMLQEEAPKTAEEAHELIGAFILDAGVAADDSQSVVGFIV